MVRKLSRRFATNRELIRILLFIFKAPTSQKVYALKQLSFPAPPIEINRHHIISSIVTTPQIECIILGQTLLINLSRGLAYWANWLR